MVEVSGVRRGITEIGTTWWHEEVGEAVGVSKQVYSDGKAKYFRYGEGNN